MKYVLLGNIASEWATKHIERTKHGMAKIEELGIKMESINYTQGQYDFVDIVDAPDAEAVLTLSLWYANQGFGRIQTMSAFEPVTIERAAEKAYFKKS